MKRAYKIFGFLGNESLGNELETGEYLSKLQGSAGRFIFDQMRRSDPAVFSTLRAVTLPLERAEWYIESASDDPKDVQIAEFVDSQIFGLSRTWIEILQHINLYLPFGFSILEKIWLPKDGHVSIVDIAPRLPQSIVGWERDTKSGKNLGPIQYSLTGRQVTLPWHKILCFTNSKEGANYEGMSILRPAYKPWYIKDQLEKINAIKHERHGVGVPVINTPPGVEQDSPEFEKAKQMAEGVAANESGYAVLPDGWSMNVLGNGASAGTDALPSIRYYDEMISKVMLAMYMNLGSTETGSRALGDTFTKQFLDSLDAHADYIAGIINRHLIRELVKYNFNDVKEFPEMKVSGIRPIDLDKISSLISGGVISKDKDTENLIRRSLGLPEVEEQAPDLSRKEHSHNHATQRKPNEIESMCDLPGIEKFFDVSAASLTDEVMSIRARQAAGISRQLAAGKVTEQITVPYKKEMFEAVKAGYQEAVAAGKREAKKEIAKQSNKFSFADPSIEELDALIIEKLKLEVDGAASKLRTIMIERYISLRQEGLDVRQAAETVESWTGENFSSATWEALAVAATNNGFSQGRREAFLEVDDSVDRYYYSSILDANRCEVCADTERDPDADSHRLDDPRFQTPNPSCLGGSNCRCLTIGILKEEAR